MANPRKFQDWKNYSEDSEYDDDYVTFEPMRHKPTFDDNVNRLREDLGKKYKKHNPRNHEDKDIL